jgi:hypothetical protein
MCVQPECGGLEDTCIVEGPIILQAPFPCCRHVTMSSDLESLHFLFTEFKEHIRHVFNGGQPVFTFVCERNTTCSVLFVQLMGKAATSDSLQLIDVRECMDKIHRRQGLVTLGERWR